MTDASERVRGWLLSHGCCMEDYGSIGDTRVILEGRYEYERLLDAYAAAIRAEERERGHNEDWHRRDGVEPSDISPAGEHSTLSYAEGHESASIGNVDEMPLASAAVNQPIVKPVSEIYTMTPDESPAAQPARSPAPEGE